MQRVIATRPTSEGADAAGAPSSDDDGVMRTEFAFELPRGYVGQDGTVHRRGVMRLATARDELLPLYDARVQENPAYTTVVLLGRVITSLGSLGSIDASVVENMFASDVAFLQDFYRRVNAEGHTRIAVTCPECSHRFTADLAGGRLGES
ncbi:hypothetical protein SAMN05428970_0642 [Agromyces sp. CF514]|uniref:hypothetical protein n=1 Tax=Agromyces sp. CF514 TaxID=1881031 RepID=UPI0008E7CCC3|nr:hypothetical protein [Agromyces sp. CF514]SFR69247.1 hypothetical protein SAMN05428970_0642 [Agromyces sp. CF514]